MPDEAPLRQFARHAIRDGTLPRRPPDRIWAGHGVGTLCTVCERPVTWDQLGCDVQFVRDGDNPGLDDKLHLHLRCFAAWEFERIKPEK
jgi:hypothetical protein